MPSFYDPYVATSLPTDVSYVSSYWTANAINSCDHNAAALPEQAEIVVVGAGYTGLSCAYELSQGYTRKVVLIWPSHINRHNYGPFRLPRADDWHNMPIISGHNLRIAF